MTIRKKDFANYIREFKFRELFNDMGWNNDRTSQPVVVDNLTYQLQAVAEKSGFKILLCYPTLQGIIPDDKTLKKIETKVAKLFHEHLLIFIDNNRQEQIWHLAVRQEGKPVKYSGIRYHISQDPELLYQRAAGLIFELDEEDHITIVDVTKRVADNFQQNNEKVTKQFYDKFKKEHTSFLSFIKGIDDKLNQDWYASLMLNRLMFCYFIQKKGFLDNNKNYLRDKLKTCQEKRGQNKFYSFYRDFLLALFHKGLGAPEHHPELIEEIGKIPYLNGGLFDEHQLEKNFQQIQIDDKAFERIFDFFDQYEWHLDTRKTASGKDINPDVIGYIFEKYINDRAQMGAYYTKEDITDYISKNCIIPFLFDETARQLKIKDERLNISDWVRESGDEYIYDAVKYGIQPDNLWGDLPAEIAIGLDTTQPELLERRKQWNKPAPAEVALPTEIWREVIERRKRYAEVKAKIENGEINHINDFITYNLNILQFAQDMVENTTDPEFLKAFYKALSEITILDPTCGSGAFLFAALNILESLYDASLQRMENFVVEAPKGKHKFFEAILTRVNEPAHPNRRYFIYKTIILNNLYGVDIMNEAVEIAKLRLFLKLVATVEVDYRKPNLGLEPLPDIDFNIRAGNTLVGFGTEAELQKGLTYTIDGLIAKPVIEEECEKVARTFYHYKKIQLSHGDNYKSFKQAKEDLNQRLKELNHELNQLLHNQATGIKYETWLQTHQPFHWFAEFYEIVHKKGGFDVIIGNPPYIAIKNIKFKMKFTDYNCSDLFGYIIKRNFQILNKNARYGFIVMHNLAFSRNFYSVRQTIKANSANAWFSFFARIPAGLFSGDVRVRNCIFLVEKKHNNKERTFHTTRIHRWFSEARNQLFPKLLYTKFEFNDIIPMYYNENLSTFFQKSSDKILSFYESRNSNYRLYFKQSAYNWIAVSTNPAPCYDNKGISIEQSQISDISFNSEDIASYSLLLLNGKLFFSHWLTYGDEFHLTRDDLITVKVPFDLMDQDDKEVLKKLSQEFINNLEQTIQFKLNAGKKVGTYNTSKLWGITDKSDQIFLKYLCNNPKEVFNAIEEHIYLTVITPEEQENEN